MSDNAERQLLALVGKQAYVSDWFTLDEPHLRQFSWSTYLDDAHVDLTASRNHPLGKNLVDGFLLLSLLTYFNFKYFPVKVEGGYGFNYGMDRVRFTAPVMLGQRIRCRADVSSAVPKGPGRLLICTRNTIEIEQDLQVAMVADWLSLFVYPV